MERGEKKIETEREYGREIKSKERQGESARVEETEQNGTQQLRQTVSNTNTIVNKLKKTHETNSNCRDTHK